MMRPVFWCMALCSSCLVLAVQAATTGDMTLVPVKVSAHAYYVEGELGLASGANQGFNSNAGFVVTDDGIVVVDALGTPALGRALIDAIRKVSSKPIKRVIVTHYHADHFYGLQSFKEIGVEVWAHQEAREYLENAEAPRRLAQRRADLFPWVDESTRIVPPDAYLQGDTEFTLGGLHFDVVYLGPAHSPEDIAVVVREDRVVFAGDIIVAGRIPFVGDADSKRWLAAIDRLLALKPMMLVVGHGKASVDPVKDLQVTKEYLVYLRSAMGKAVADFVPFDEAFGATDWSRFSKLPAFGAANHINAYGTYLTMERESLQSTQPNTD
ncbi:MAG: MBL fold metallo-hydrolase [Betaproteobacteria bacterium]